MSTYQIIRSFVPASLLACALAGCQGARTSPPRSDSTAATTAVDSTLSREEALRRFRIGVDSVDSLSGGAASEADLVRRFVAAISARDTAALGELVMTRQEFAWVYYPTTPQGLPPYDLAPNLLWFLLEGRGTQGLTKALRDLGDKSLRYRSHQCDAEPSIEGENRVRGPCQVTVSVDGGPASAVQLFGSILERNGRFKFLNYSNKLN